MTTSYSNKAVILADLWLNYRGDEDFAEFIEANDLGLPLSYALANGIIQTTPLVEDFINESFGSLLDGLEIEDTDFDSLDEILLRVIEG